MTFRNGRTYMYYKDDVLYPFGYGLSYTTFDYQQIKSVKQDKDKVTVTVLVKIRVAATVRKWCSCMPAIRNQR